MAIKYVLFDLDGTLLPMDQDVFVQTYFKKLTQKMAPLGYEPDKLINAIWTGISKMVQNDGKRSNETVFWESFEEQFGSRVKVDRLYFDEFYKNEFGEVQSVCGKNPLAIKCVELLSEHGYAIVLATNPVFPAVATQSRIRWAGFSPEQFTLYTTYENTSSGKPNLLYYREIAQKLGCKPEECLMVGNDVDEDMVASKLGMSVFLLTDCLLNRHNLDISKYPNGSFKDFLTYINRELIK